MAHIPLHFWAHLPKSIAIPDTAIKKWGGGFKTKIINGKKKRRVKKGKRREKESEKEVCVRVCVCVCVCEKAGGREG